MRYRGRCAAVRMTQVSASVTVRLMVMAAPETMSKGETFAAWRQRVFHALFMKRRKLAVMSPCGETGALSVLVQALHSSLRCHVPIPGVSFVPPGRRGVFTSKTARGMSGDVTWLSLLTALDANPTLIIRPLGLPLSPGEDFRRCCPDGGRCARC